MALTYSRALSQGDRDRGMVFARKGGDAARESNGYQEQRRDNCQHKRLSSRHAGVAGPYLQSTFRSAHLNGVGQCQVLHVLWRRKNRAPPDRVEAGSSG